MIKSSKEFVLFQIHRPPNAVSHRVLGQARVSLYFTDPSGKEWKFNFIYYNNKFFDEKGTRNEYRLTGMTAFFRENGLKAGDDIILTHNEDDTYSIRYKRKNAFVVREVSAYGEKKKNRLVIGSNWKVIDC